MNESKCPYCSKDYNEEEYQAKETIIPKVENNNSMKSTDDDFLNIENRYCHFCKKYFHEIFSCNYNAYRTKGNFNKFINDGKNTKSLIKHPYLNAKFESKNVPKYIKQYFQEAEMCRSVGSKTGTASCLRKTIYAICDEHEMEGKDYRVKINNFPIRGETFKDLMKEIKWLGDNENHSTKPSDERYTINDLDIAIGILPSVIDRIYENDEKESEAQKLLKKSREG